MKNLNDFKLLFNSLFDRKNPNERKMKRVFQWRRFLEWKDLTSEEQISAKRLLFLPLLAYLILGIFNNNFLLIVIFLIGYLLYKKFEKGSIVRK